MSSDNVDEILDYLSEWRTSKEIRERFDYTNARWFKVSRWLLKGNFIERCSTLLNNKTNRVYVFRRMDKK